MENEIYIYLNRYRRTDQGTEGVLSVPSLSFSCYVLELPWRDNRRNVSCIPPGTYPLSWRVSKKYRAFHIRNVPDRSFILIHAGNFAGDTSLGFKTHSEGCPMLGDAIGTLQGQVAVLNSRATVRAFNALLRNRKCRITITETIEANHG